MHLAGLSNDPMGELDARTYAINRDASIRIARLAKQAGVRAIFFPRVARFTEPDRNSTWMKTILSIH